MAKLNKWERQHLKNLLSYEALIDEVYKTAAREAADIGTSLSKFNPDKMFSFSDYPQTKRRVDTLLETLKNSLTTVIVNGVRSEWTLANNKNNELCNQVFGDNVGKLSKAAYKRYYSSNPDALEAFTQRKTAGLNLSDRVWNYTNQFKTEIEMGLDVGIRNGLSADEMSRQLRTFLKYPDKLFRRVRDEHNKLQLSKNAAAFHPGRGVYRSSYKNARRLAATESNIAYRTADYLRWQDLDFVVGILIEPSKTNHETDICDDLKGKYPKNFKWTGWHPHCRCHALTITKTQDEMAADTKRILNGEEPSQDSENSVQHLPRKYEDWVIENKDRIFSAKSKPYFLLDNGTFTDDGKYRIKDFDGRGSLTVKASAKAKKVSVSTPQGETTEIVQQTLEETTAKLEKMGWYYSDSKTKISDLEGAWAKLGYGRFDIEKLDKDISEIFSNLGHKDLEKIFKWNAETGEARIFINSLWGEVQIIRDFKMKDGKMSVHHSLFELAEELQGKGTSKKVLNAFYDQYLRLGITDIDVYANIDVGGYTWCRYGFCTKQKEVSDLLFRIKKRHPKNYSEWQQMTKIVSDYYDKHDSSALFPMNLLTDVPNAKKILAGESWVGILDLTNPVQRKVFEKYLGR